MDNKKKSGGFIGAVILLIVGVSILWNNEGRTVKVQNSINESLKSYVDVSSKKIDKKNNKKLIATTGKIDLSNSKELKDGKFGISVKAVKLKRIVEMYQWTEDCDDDKNCVYEKDWSSDIIDSEEFVKSDHVNPKIMKIQSDEYSVSDIKVGAYEIPERLIEKLSYNKTLKNDELEEKYVNKREGYNVVENYITNATDYENPEIGNIRISYKYASDGEVSIMGVQRDNTITAFTATNGKSIFDIRRGSYTGREVLESMISSNNTKKWFLRVVGMLLIMLASSAFFAPLQALTNKIPVVGSIVNVTASLFGAVIGTSISLIVVAIAWFRFRPVLSIVLIVLVIILIMIFKLKSEKIEKKK